MLAIHPGEILREEYMAPLGFSAASARIPPCVWPGISGLTWRCGSTYRRSMKPAFWKGKRGRSSCGSSRIGLYRLPFSSYGKVYLSRHLVGRGSGVCGAVRRVSQLVMAGRGTGRGLAWNRPACPGYVEGHGSEQGADP